MTGNNNQSKKGKGRARKEPTPETTSSRSRDATPQGPDWDPDYYRRQKREHERQERERQERAKRAAVSAQNARQGPAALSHILNDTSSSQPYTTASSQPHTSAPNMTNILTTSQDPYKHRQQVNPCTPADYQNTGIHQQRPLPDFIPPSRQDIAQSSSTTNSSVANTSATPTGPTVLNPAVAPARKQAPHSRKPAPDLKGRGGRPPARNLPPKPHQTVQDVAYHPSFPPQWYCCQCEDGPNNTPYCMLPTSSKRRPRCGHQYCVRCKLMNGPWPNSKRT